MNVTSNLSQAHADSHGGPMLWKSFSPLVLADEHELANINVEAFARAKGASA
jgi:hypothetical protein